MDIEDSDSRHKPYPMALVLPIPGTFILGGLVMFVGIGLYLLRGS